MTKYGGKNKKSNLSIKIFAIACICIAVACTIAVHNDSILTIGVGNRLKSISNKKGKLLKASLFYYNNGICISIKYYLKIP